MTGRRADDGDRCTVVVIHEHSGYWGVYPHGFATFGVRLARAEAVKVAQAILDGTAGAGTPARAWSRAGTPEGPSGERPRPGRVARAAQLRRLSPTDAGTLRYAALGEPRRDDPQAPLPEHVQRHPVP